MFYPIQTPAYDSETKLFLGNKIMRVKRENYNKVEAIVNGKIDADTKFPVQIQEYFNEGWAANHKEAFQSPSLKWFTTEEKKAIENRALQAQEILQLKTENKERRSRQNTLAYAAESIFGRWNSSK